MSRPVPPEVVLDYHSRQVLARDEQGNPFQQYAFCAGGCGYLIGCGDAIDLIWHESCAAPLSPSTNSREPECP